MDATSPSSKSVGGASERSTAIVTTWPSSKSIGGASERSTAIVGGSDEKNSFEFFGWVYHLGVNSIGHDYRHLRFLFIRGKYVAMYKRDPHENPGIDLYVLRFYNRLDEAKKGEVSHSFELFLSVNVDRVYKIACATAGEAQRWIEAFDHAKQKAEHELSRAGSAREKLSMEAEINLEGHRPRVRRYAYGLRKLIRIGQGPETLLRQSSMVAGGSDGFEGDNGDAFDAHQWKCVRTMDGIRIFEDVSDSKNFIDIMKWDILKGFVEFFSNRKLVGIEVKFFRRPMANLDPKTLNMSRPNQTPKLVFGNIAADDTTGSSVTSGSTAANETGWTDATPGKDDYLTGAAKAPDQNTSAHKKWKAEDHMVMSWLVNSMTTEVGDNFLLYPTSHEIWEAAKEAYSTQEKSAEIYEVECVLHDLKQEQKRLYKFLMGLTDSFEEVRSRILGRNTLPSLKEAFSEVRCEESRKKINHLSTTKSPLENSAMAARSNIPRSSKQCDHCHKKGHTKDTCWEIHGKPANWKPRPRANHADTTNNGETHAEPTLFSKDQLELLQKLFGKTTVSDPHTAHVAQSDLKTNQHLYNIPKTQVLLTNQHPYNSPKTPKIKGLALFILDDRKPKKKRQLR
ncbi:protein ENHANCED DISEASE RESISTANCE 2-like [Senna tora]|uniref:Protein ENHANCED DISEASE RESISTANCE 2-like n=1 Tax=Senna tora TaxID=362788 RepID=A0A834X7T1_9FABA|nr:protein ENHANCED DISEASE RESISTANCE 2-like [Senna tora]